uniref:Uncharacterized protein n=1 Tax=Arion vulgaris TaxID=1028688 RepID=A0A0B6ZXG0_9EUPU
MWNFDMTTMTLWSTQSQMGTRKTLDSKDGRSNVDPHDHLSLVKVAEYIAICHMV